MYIIGVYLYIYISLMKPVNNSKHSFQSQSSVLTPAVNHLFKVPAGRSSNVLGLLGSSFVGVFPTHRGPRIP